MTDDRLPTTDDRRQRLGLQFTVHGKTPSNHFVCPSVNCELSTVNLL